MSGENDGCEGWTDVDVCPFAEGSQQRDNDAEQEIIDRGEDEKC